MSKHICLAAVLLLASMCSTAAAQELACDSCDMSSPAKSCFAGCFGDESLWNQSTLTGDWGGLRTTLQQSGVTFAGRSTQFGFGVAGGNTSLPPVPLPLGLGDTFKYTGRGEYDVILDLEKFGGLPHGSLLVRFEHWYGQFGNVSLDTGALPPAIFPAALPPAPNNPGELFLTNFVVTQPLSEHFVMFFGKKDLVGGGDQDLFAGGDGTSQFMNQALVANPAYLLGLPYSSLMAGVVMPQDWGMISAFASDATDRTQDFFDLDNIFGRGVIVGTEVKVKTRFFGKPGDQHVGGLWKQLDRTDLRFAEPPPGVYPEPTVPGFPTLPSSWTLYYGFDQYLMTFTGQKQKGWGAFGRASISDGNPSVMRYFLSAGLGGDSQLRHDKGDTWGVGWYYTGTSHEFGPLPQLLFGPREGTGLEMFYNIQINPWMNVTPDIQFIKPEATALADQAVVYGLRVNMTL